MAPNAPPIDIAIVGAGAAGLAAAIFVARERPSAGIAVFDGARNPGAKILVSGGGRCNVTNRHVTEADFNGGSRRVIGQVLRALPVARTIEFFESIGVTLHEEPEGKLFPDTNRSRTVLDALLNECRERRITIFTDRRVTSTTPSDPGFMLESAAGSVHARLVLLATGGLALPKSGSNGAGYSFARLLGHTLVPPTPALVPLSLAGDIHAEMSGVSLPVELTLSGSERRPLRVRGPLLWTHFGLSGPAVLDISRHWLRARLEDIDVALDVNLLPGSDLASADRRLVELVRERPRMQVTNALATWVPAAVAATVCRLAELETTTTLGQLTREERGRLAHRLTALRLPVTGSRGYHQAEVTAGGIPLQEVDTRTLQSRLCPGLFFAGEILDVDGRLGGFNFQWAWASAKVASVGMVRSWK